MKNTNALRNTLTCLAVVLGVFGVHAALADPPGALIDDFSDPRVNSLGIERLFITDVQTGGQTSLNPRFEDGVFHATGQITPPRGQPGWASTALLLDAQGGAVDVSRFEGLRLRVRITQGSLSITANSTEVTNFDFHGALVTRQAGDDFHEVRIPFSSMKRAWSEQTPLDPATLASVTLVAFGMQPGAFAYEVDEVGFY